MSSPPSRALRCRSRAFATASAPSWPTRLAAILLLQLTSLGVSDNGWYFSKCGGPAVTNILNCCASSSITIEPKVNIRESPSTEARILAVVRRDAVLHVTAVEEYGKAPWARLDESLQPFLSLSATKEVHLEAPVLFR